MKYVVYLASATFAISIAGGMVVVALPQAGLLYQLGSDQIGLLTAAQPLGYAVGCIGLGQLLRSYCGKRVMLAGTALSAVAILVSTRYQTVGPLFTWLFIYGIGLGGFWPFTSAWMLDYTEIPRTRILRWYNVSWTSGAAIGMYIAGVLCKNGDLLYCFYTSAAIATLSCIGPLLTPGPQTHLHPVQEEVLKPKADPIGLPILLAGILANVTALGTRVMISYTYPELNRALNFNAERMGLFGAVALCGQLMAFVFGAVYERHLGSRRLYAAMITVLIATTLIFGTCTNIVLLTAAMGLCGVITALGFQAAILAATEWFTSRRIGTTVHEGLVGFAQILPMVAGMLTQNAKNSGTATLDALKLPFFVLPVALGVVMLLQLVLVSSSKTRRLLLPRAELAKAALPQAVPAPAQIVPSLPLMDGK